MASPVRAEFIENRDAFDHRAVDRDHVAVADEQPVARRDRLERHLLQPAVAVPHRRARHALEQGRHLPPGPPLGEELEVLAPRIHQRDHGGSQFLAEDEGSAHRQRRDDVETEVPAA